jgi:hypothetical protein
MIGIIEDVVFEDATEPCRDCPLRGMDRRSW